MNFYFILFFLKKKVFFIFFVKKKEKEMTWGTWRVFDKLGTNASVKSVFPNNDHDGVPGDVDLYVGIPLIINDIMVQMRKIHPREFLGDDGVLRRETTRQTFMHFFGYILDILRDSDVERYFACFDPLGMSRLEKKATGIARARIPKGEPEFLEMPDGQSRYFEMDKPFPTSNASLIFRTMPARRELYHAIRLFLMSDEFRTRIAENKAVVLCGGYNMDEDKNLPPLFIARDSVTLHEELVFPTCSEGDLYAIWVARHFKGNFIVQSGDGDLLFTLLLAMDKILEADPDRQCWFVTPRCAGTVEQDVSQHQLKILHHKSQIYEQALQNGVDPKDLHQNLGSIPSVRSFVLKKQRSKTNAVETLSAPSSSSTHEHEGMEYIPSSSSAEVEVEEEVLMMKKREWRMRYVNMVTLYQTIHNEATGHHAHHGFKIHSPITNMVAGFLLTSKKHDYINSMTFAPGIGSQVIWDTFMAHQKECANMVQIGYGPDRVTGKTTQHIIVDAEVVRKLLFLCYETVARKRKNPQASLETMTAKAPAPHVTYAVAAQLAWTLHYWSMGSIRAARIEDGLLTHEGFSVYGFDASGWSNNVNHLNNQRICPFQP